MDNPTEVINIHNELCTSYHAIDDFRAKLLGILPLVTGTGISFLLDELANIHILSMEMKRLLAGVGMFGTLITLGLFAYEIFGIKKCAALIEAGREIESALKIQYGQFKRRPTYVAFVIDEPFAAGIIYPTVLAAWIYFALAFMLPQANPWTPILVLTVGFVGTETYDYSLRKPEQEIPLDEKHQVWLPESSKDGM